MKSLLTLLKSDYTLRPGAVWNHIHDGKTKYTVLYTTKIHVVFKVEYHDGGKFPYMLEDFRNYMSYVK